MITIKCQCGVEVLVNGISCECPSCGRIVIRKTASANTIPKPSPYMKVKDLLAALRGADPELGVTIRATSGDESFIGGIRFAEVEDNCGGVHFAIDADDEDAALELTIIDDIIDDE